jgi:MarR family transcriptional regulator for hemolysin
VYILRLLTTMPNGRAVRQGPSRVVMRHWHVCMHHHPDQNGLNSSYLNPGELRWSWVMDETPSLDIRQVFGSRLGHTSRRWRCAVGRAVQPFGLTEATYLPLLYVARGRGPMRQKDLADAIGIEGSSLVRLIDALDHAGLIERQTDKDRRARVICLTPRGRALVEQVEAAAAEIRQRLLAGITDTELTIALSVIERICAALDRLYTPEPACVP